MSRYPLAEATRRSPRHVFNFRLQCRARACLFLAGAALVLPAKAEVSFDGKARIWSLRSGPVEYRLGEKNKMVYVDYFGPTGGKAWPDSRLKKGRDLRFESDGEVSGQFLRAEDLELSGHRIAGPAAETTELILEFSHRQLPLRIAVTYTTWGDTGVITRHSTVRNVGSAPLALAEVTSLAWLLPPGDYGLDYLHGSHGDERQLETEKLQFGQRRFLTRMGRSTKGYSPWFCLRDEKIGVRYAAQLAYSGNWEMSFERVTFGRRVRLLEHELQVKLGMRFDVGGPAPLAPGATIEIPMVAFTASTGDLDDIANQLKRYQRKYVIPTSPINDPLITQYNSFISLGRSPHINELKHFVDLAADIGLEAFGPDASWAIKTKEGKTLYGEWIEDPVGFPNGLKELADYVHSKNMKLCIWLEPESVSRFSPIAKKHPEWILRRNGQPIEGTVDRVPVDFRNPEVRAWARAVVDRLVREVGIDWLKIDFNTDLGEAFDEPEGRRTGTVVYEHTRHLYAWLEGIRKDFPRLLIEGCASGGLRFDLGIMRHTHATWISDMTDPRPTMQIAYGATLEFPAEVGYHWMDAREGKSKAQAELTSPRGWWDFMFRASMNGMFGIASDLGAWTPEIKQAAAENVALYKRIRTLIKGSDVYHLSPPPAPGDSPTGWMALQYAAPKGDRGVLMAYRLGKSETRQTYRPRGLAVERTFAVYLDGVRLDRGGPVRLTGRELATEGFTVELAEEWRAAVIEFVADGAAGG